MVAQWTIGKGLNTSLEYLFASAREAASSKLGIS